MAIVVVPTAVVVPTIYHFSFDRKRSSIVACSTVSSRNRAALMPVFLSKRNNVEPCDRVVTKRRSGNYKPPTWDIDYIQTLSSQYVEDRYMKRVGELVAQMKKLLEESPLDAIRKLELIDDLQNMGISYYFDDEIYQILKSMHNDHGCKYNKCKDSNTERELYSTSLEFRLLRQHGFTIGQEVFDCFKNDKGDFKPSLSDDTRGLLQLYEASFLLTEGEETLEKAREFATHFLRKKLDDEGDNGMLIDENLSLYVRNALELPIHWRIQRPNARWFIEAYERRTNTNPIVLELAKLDFNIVQAMFHEELKQVSRWWKQTRLAEYLPFARDRVVENYLWTVGVISHPQYGYERIMAAKVNALITVIDDIFDVYGSLEELQIFHDLTQRWDIEAIDQLPHYMQICYLALNNFIEEMAYDILKEKGFVIIPHLRKFWAGLCCTYLQEAKWYSRAYTPTLEEYFENAWISIAAPVILSHLYFLVSNPIDDEAIRSLYEDHNIIRYSGMILRLANDLGTSSDEMKRGDVPKSIECYMKERNASREDAEEYVRNLIWKTWKKMNEERVINFPFPQNFVASAVNLGRMAQFMYQNGDGHGIQNDEIKKRISTILFEPIS